MIRRLVTEDALAIAPLLRWDEVQRATRKELLWSIFLMMVTDEEMGAIPLARFRLFGGMVAADTKVWFAVRWDEWAAQPNNATGTCAAGKALLFKDLLRAYSVPGGGELPWVAQAVFF